MMNRGLSVDYPLVFKLPQNILHLSFEAGTVWLRLEHMGHKVLPLLSPFIISWLSHVKQKANVRAEARTSVPWLYIESLLHCSVFFSIFTKLGDHKHQVRNTFITLKRNPKTNSYYMLLTALPPQILATTIFFLSLQICRFWIVHIRLNPWGIRGNSSFT